MRIKRQPSEYVIDRNYGTVKQKDVNRAKNSIQNALDLLYELRDMSLADSKTDIYLSNIIVPLYEALDNFIPKGR